VVNPAVSPSQEIDADDVSLNVNCPVVCVESTRELPTDGFLIWPLVYELPPFPAIVTRALVMAKSSAELSASTHRIVTRILYDHIVQYTL